MTEQHNPKDATRSADEPHNAALEEKVRLRTAELEDANKALREIKTQFEAVYNHHYQLTGLIDMEGRLIMANGTALKFAGVESEDVIGKNFWETPWWTHSQEEQRKLREAMAQAIRGQMSQFESTHVSAAGEMRKIDFRIRPVFDENGEVIYMVPEGYDITERLQAEASLRESEEKYRTFFQNSCDPMMMLRNGLFIDCNDAAIKMLGYKGVEEVVNLDPAELSPEYQSDGKKSSEKAKAMIGVAHAQGTHRFEWEHRRRNGDVFPVEVSMTAMPSEGGIVLLAVWRDISDRREAEESLYRQADFDSIITRILARFARCSAAEVDDSIEKSLEEIGRFALADSAYVILIAPDHKTWRVAYSWVALGFPNYISDYQNVPMGTLPWTESKILSGEIVRITNIGDYPPEADSERRLFERDGVRSELLMPMRGRDGQVAGCVGFRSYERQTNWVPEDFPRIKLACEAIVNVLERKRAEESLQHSEERYRSLVSTMQDIIYSVSADGRILFIGPQIERYGFTVAEMISQPFTDFVFPEDRDTVLRDFQQTLATGEQTIMTFRIATKNGNVVWFEEIGQPVRDAAGNIVSISGMLRDVTERKQLESRLQLAQKMEAIGTLAGGIAHDFNNILSAIFGFADLAQMKLETGERVEEDLNQITAAGHRARDLVQQILTFSRQTDYVKNPIQIKTLIKEVLKFIRASLPTTINIRHSFNVKNGVVIADPTQIHQILMNLCTNAAHAMKDKGGDMDIRLDDIALDEETATVFNELGPGNYLKLTISDTGCGIPKGLIHKIFDPFYTTKEREGGTGLGLSVVHGIVKDMQGEIIVNSEAGVGTTFEIYIPRHEGETTVLDASLSVVKGGKGTILLVDDEEAIVSSCRGNLTRIGYEVIASTDPFEALTLFKERPEQFDLVITDLTMPGMTGFELSGRLTQIKPGIPILLCTGFSDDIRPERFSASGVREVIMKPLIISELAEVVQKTLSSDSHC